MPSYNPDKAGLAILFELCFFLANFAALFWVIVAVLHFFFCSDNPIYITSVLPLRYASDPLVLLFFGIIYFFAYGAGIWNALFHATFILTYAFYLTPFICWELRIGRTSYKTIPELRNSQNLLRVYRWVEIPHGVAMTTYGCLIIPAQAIFAQIILLCVVMLIRHGVEFVKDPTLILMLGGLSAAVFSFWSIILRFGSFFYVQAKRTVSSWKLLYFIWNRKEAKYLSKFKKSCRTLRIGYPGYYSMNNLSLLKFWKFIARGTFRALIGLKS